MTCAAYYGHTDVIKELIENGADVNLVRLAWQLHIAAAAWGDSGVSCGSWLGAAAFYMCISCVQPCQRLVMQVRFLLAAELISSCPCLRRACPAPVCVSAACAGAHGRHLAPVAGRKRAG
jgi:hypothetical protein